ncbi:AAA family ATPase [Micromonospora sp. DT47]|uniref:AAA family ATPase n=1 Tax=Micromonospora sp. DT47 TaxID=3393431 RepID=UPI003CEEC499
MSLSIVGTGHEDVTGASWPVPEERRTLTVLFADIVGSTALTERLDPEDVRALQHAYFDTVAGVLRRWQGVVEKYVGDAVMALFGARSSDGLDAYRAVRAGLEIQAALDRRAMPGGVALRVRVGVATGEAIVDLAGARDGGHGAASGAVTTTAARLQEYAPAGGVVVCGATHRAVAGLVDQHELSAAVLAGKASPVDVWRVTGPGRPRPVRHTGPLIGRRRELATAADQIARAVREHRPRWVSLVGPDGIGRSRLLHELRRSLRQVDGVPVRWCVAHCPPYPDGVRAPVADLVRDLAGVRETAAAAVVRRRLAALADGTVPADRAGSTVDALEALLNAPDRSLAAARGAAALRQVLLALAARQPLVVAVDDVDRATPELRRFLHALFTAATARALPLAVLATHRLNPVDPLPGPGDRCRRVALPPLGTVDAGRLLRGLLTRAGRPAALAGRLLPLVAGIPGSAAAYVAAVDATTPEPALPEVLRRGAAARLDRLDGRQRAVLMAGATLGVGCTGPAVDRLLGWEPGRAAGVLRRLAGEGLVRRGRHGGYAIVDPALRRVAYERLPRAVRAEFARRAERSRRSAGTTSADQPASGTTVPPPGATVPPPGAAESAGQVGAAARVGGRHATALPDPGRGHQPHRPPVPADRPAAPGHLAVPAARAARTGTARPGTTVRNAEGDRVRPHLAVRSAAGERVGPGTAARTVAGTDQVRPGVAARTAATDLVRPDVAARTAGTDLVRPDVAARAAGTGVGCPRLSACGTASEPGPPGLPVPGTAGGPVGPSRRSAATPAPHRPGAGATVPADTAAGRRQSAVGRTAPGTGTVIGLLATRSTVVGSAGRATGVSGSGRAGRGLPDRPVSGGPRLPRAA